MDSNLSRAVTVSNDQQYFKENPLSDLYHTISTHLTVFVYDGYLEFRGIIRTCERWLKEKKDSSAD